MSKKRFLPLIFFLVLVCIGVGNAADLVEPPEFIVAGVIGASMENAQAPEDFVLGANSWYNAGHYKTWVDYIACYLSRDYHWLNYARAGEVSINGLTHLNNLLTQTIPPVGEPVSSVSLLVIGFWANDFVWIPVYDAQVMDAMVQNVNAQIQAAKSAGIEKIVILGWPDYNDLNLQHFISLFAPLTHCIDEDGYNQSKEHFYNVFSAPNSDYLFVEPWCRFKTFDGAHPSSFTSKNAAVIIRNAIRRYDKLVGKKSLFCR
jgi:hypothetical protein